MESLFGLTIRYGKCAATAGLSNQRTEERRADDSKSFVLTRNLLVSATSFEIKGPPRPGKLRTKRIQHADGFYRVCRNRSWRFGGADGGLMSA